MSKFFKTLSGEMYKTFRYPLTYVCIALLVVALIVSCFTFKSQNDKVVAFHLNGQTKDDIYSNFLSQDSMNKTKADTQLEEAHSKVATLNNKNESTLANIKALVGENSTLDNEGGALWIYKNRFTPALNSSSINDLKNYSDAIILKLNSAKSEINDAVKSDDISILITENNYKNLIKDLEQCVEIFVLSSKAPNELSTYQDIAKKINNSNALDNLKNYTIKDMTNITISAESLENLNSLYSKAKTYQETLLSTSETQKTNKNVGIQTYRNTLLNYFYVTKQYTSLVENTILYDNVLNLSDATIRKYKGYNDKTIYSLRESITKNEYLLENNKTELNYATPFKAGLLSSEENVFDLMYYGLSICGIILLLFSVVLITRQFSGEFSDGSFKVLLTHSAKRHKVLTAKMLSTLLICLAFMLVSTLILFIVGAITYGVESTTILAVFNGGSAFEVSPFALLAIFFGLETIKIFFFILIATTISIIFRHQWISGTISVVLLVLTITAPLFLNNSIIFAYTPLAGIDMFKYFGSGLLVGNENVFLSLLESHMYLNSNFYVSLASVSATMLICLILSYSLLQARELK